MDLGSINYISQYITSPGSTNKPGYVILIGTSTQHPTTDYKPPAGYTTALLISLTHYSIYNLLDVNTYAVSNSYPPLPPAPWTKMLAHALVLQGSACKLFSDFFNSISM